jgi:hypothetical protein
MGGAVIPGKREWRSYTALEKVTYIAQALVLPTLAVTFVFSFLTWKEAKTGQELAKAAQEQERAFFIAQNPPQLELTGGRVFESDVGPMLFLSIKNVGDSAARSPCVDVHRLEDGVETRVTTDCGSDGANPNTKATIPKGEGVTFHISQRGYLRFKPTKVIIRRPEELETPGPLCTRSRTDSFLVALRFRDIAGEQKQIVRQMILCG